MNPLIRNVANGIISEYTNTYGNVWESEKQLLQVVFDVCSFWFRLSLMTNDHSTLSPSWAVMSHQIKG